MMRANWPQLHDSQRLYCVNLCTLRSASWRKDQVTPYAEQAQAMVDSVVATVTKEAGREQINHEVIQASVRTFLTADLMSLTSTEALVAELKKRVQADPLQFDAFHEATFHGDDNYPIGTTVAEAVLDWIDEKPGPQELMAGIRLNCFIDLGQFDARLTDGEVEIVK